MGSSAKSQRPTITLLFVAITLTLGTWFNGGFCSMTLNVPEAHIINWIRSVECDRYTDTDNHTESHQRWCRNVSVEEEQFLTRDNVKLNATWALTNTAFDCGLLASAFSAFYFIRRFATKGTVLIGSGVFLAGTLMCALSSTFAMYELLVFGRFLCGAAQGVNSLSSNLYLAEISPAKIRGAICTIPIIMMISGMIVSNIFGLPMLLGTELYWPILVALPAVPVIIMCFCLPFCPDSPRRLFFDKEDKVGAFKALVWLRRTSFVQDEMMAMQTELDLENKGQVAPLVTVFGIFKDRYLRYVLGLCAVPMLAKQWSGYMCIFYYSTSIFKSAGLDNLNSALATCGMWSIYLVFALLSMMLIDRLGRKVLLLLSHTGMIISMSLFTVFMVLSTRYDVPWAKYCCAGSMVLYMATYGTGSATVPWVLPAELFPPEARIAALTWISILCSVAGLVTSLLFPFVVFVLEEYTFLLFVAAVSVLSVFIIWKLPESKGKSFEEIQAVLRRRFR